MRLTAHFTSTHRLKSKGFSTEGVVIRRGFPCPRLLSTSGSLSPLKNGECCGCRDKHRAVSCSEVFCTDLLCSGLLYECSCLISWKMTGVEILCVFSIARLYVPASGRHTTCLAFFFFFFFIRLCSWLLCIEFALYLLTWLNKVLRLLHHCVPVCYFSCSSTLHTNANSCCLQTGPGGWNRNRFSWIQ